MRQGGVPTAVEPLFICLREIQGVFVKSVDNKKTNYMIKILKSVVFSYQHTEKKLQKRTMNSKKKYIKNDTPTNK